MVFLQAALLIVLSIGQATYAFTAAQCKWYCTFTKNENDRATKCPKCVENPPINYAMCYHACGRTQESFHMAIICNKCFVSDSNVMNTVCRLACLNTFQISHISVCSFCRAKEDSDALEN